MDANLEKNKKLFKYLRNTFRFAMCWWAVFLGIAYFSEDSSGQMAGVLMLVGMANGLAYLYFLGTLAARAGKNSSLWVLGAFLFPILGVALTYLNMKTVAIQNGWD